MLPRSLKALPLVFLLAVCSQAAEKPPLTFDEFFDSVSFSSVAMSPDGHAAVIVTERADWQRKIYRQELWLSRDSNGGTLLPLTQSGRDSDPKWSPDGKWIAFFSERDNPGPKTEDDVTPSNEKDYALYLISPDGGEAIPVTRGSEEVHAFAWSADSKTLFFSTRKPLTKQQKDDREKNWKDVERYRAGERGDVIFRIAVSEVLARQSATNLHESEDDNPNPDETPGSQRVADAVWRANELEASADGKWLAFASESLSEREEMVEEYEIYTVDLQNPAKDQTARRVTHNEAVEHAIRWSRDGKHVFFLTEVGSVEGKYEDVQPRLYWVDIETGKAERWAAGFQGTIDSYAVRPDAGVLAAGRIGTEVQVYSQSGISAPFSKLQGWLGTYESLNVPDNSSRLAFIYSALEKPTEVYLADGPESLQNARALTSFNKVFTERNLPKGKPFQWKADDGTTVEGMLMYPPGKFEAKNLPLFVLIHGGPADADGNHFAADWYVWDRLAATNGWLVFEPNYRGSSGYGDDFLKGIVPEIVSRPGKDILEGVDALVKAGIADPNHLAVGGYSYGGYMTDWLITQSTQWKAAVTGAGAVEHAANWGNDDTTFDDAYFLGGQPWEQPQRYLSEAALFQMNKVRTPTHIVAGEDDIRVAVEEDYLLDHALHNLGIPSNLLIFPGEGHSLDKDPWHGRIKVREELKWLQKYGGVGTAPPD